MAEQTENTRSKSVLDVLSRWFKASEDELPQEVADKKSAVAPAAAAPKSAVEGRSRAPQTPLKHSEISSKTMTITERLALLKQILEFDSEVATKLQSIRSSRELLGYFHEVLFHRFTKLREIGVITANSARVLDQLNVKVVDALRDSSAQSESGEAGRDPQELLRENNDLKKEISDLNARYMKTGIVTETELTQDKEIKYLQGRVREQRTQLKLAQQRLKSLVSYQEMVQTLKARNGILVSKVENQARLLRSLTAENPNHQKLVSIIERLNDENKHLKVEMGRQSGVLSQLKSTLPPESLKAIEEVLERNRQLNADVMQRQHELNSVEGAEGSPPSLLQQMERLEEDNEQLKNLIDTKRFMEGFLRSEEAETGDPTVVIERLRSENQKLEQALNEKDEMMKAFSGAAQKTPLFKAYTNLKQEYRQLHKETQLKEQMYRADRDEKQCLQRQVRERTLLIKENQRLRAEMETSKRWLELLRKSEQQCQVLKKERAETALRWERTEAELIQVRHQLAKTTGEYNLLIGEYQKIFDGQ